MEENKDLFGDSIGENITDTPLTETQPGIDPSFADGKAPGIAAPDPSTGSAADPSAGTAESPAADITIDPSAGIAGNPAADAAARPSAAMPQEPSAIPAGADASPGAQSPEKPPKKRFSLKDWIPGPQVPNQLTIARVCMVPLFVACLLWVPKPAGNILAMIVFILASLTDTADGYIARRYHYVTNFGKFMDPLADKLLVCSALICLVDLGRIESWIVIVIIAREFIISGFRLVAAEQGVVIAANIWGKVKTVIQMLMVILMVGNFKGFLGTAAQILKWAALALTLISLATYLFKNRHVLHESD